MEYLLLILGLVILIKGGDWLLNASVSLSLKLNIPKLIVGLTVVSFATSAPELMVSVLSALNNSPDIAVGNVVGSNIANIAFILGVVLLFSSISLNNSFFQKDFFVLVYSSILFFIFSFWDGKLGFWDGLILLISLIVYIIILMKSMKGHEPEIIVDNIVHTSWFKIIFLLIIGVLSLYFGSELLVNNSVSIAKQLGVSEKLIGITIIAVGTSLPELVASLVAIKKKENAISFGNIVGSNIFNILGVLGISSIIHPINVASSFLLFDFWWMISLVLLIPIFSFLPKRGTIDYKLGILMLLIYGGYLCFSI